ncbi:Gfo/Idh/MocA family protein [Polaromonas jejuensis]|uniref:Gfo/Idh/MocA family protein n=1 Tax=Polaromonas jejuensis TaxID=457502 RepID=A0ABW0QK95_9BURK|nr:Gfo/Idh/MocA family oxidoreductase [Polaromonas jejuensis]
MTNRTLKIGVVGLGRAFTLMLPTFVHDSRVKLVGATDPIAAARAQFEKDFGAPGYESMEALCANPAVEVLYIASPHQFHAAHVCLAASHGKHVMVEKPMALTVHECTRMIEATRRAGVHLIVGHSHSFNTPIRRTREIIDSGRYGAVRMINALNFTDFLYRPRRPEELDTQAGGGVIHSQATHQMDIVRLLGGGLVNSVRAHTGSWDAARPTEGAYSALLGFEGGAFASATYSGYGHYDSDELMDNIGEMGQAKDPDDYGAARKRLQNAATSTEESALKAARNYGGSLYVPGTALPQNLAHQHFGQIIVNCEKADLRPGATGIAIYTDSQKVIETLPAPVIPRREVIDELFATVVKDRPAVHSGEWARATTAVCLALLQSARTGSACRPRHQVSHNAGS